MNAAAERVGASPPTLSEHPDTVAEAVASILRADVKDTPADLRDVVRHRAAARRIIEANLPPAPELRLLRSLGASAAASRFPDWCLEAIVAEIVEPELPNLIPRGVAGRSGWLRRQGYRSCPTCHRDLIPEITADENERNYRYTEHVLAARERAVPRGLR